MQPVLPTWTYLVSFYALRKLKNAPLLTNIKDKAIHTACDFPVGDNISVSGWPAA